MNAGHWICSVYLFSYLFKIVRTKEIRIGSSSLMVYFFPTIIHSCPLCWYFSNFNSTRTIYPHQKTSQDCLVQPCHSGFHLFLRFGSAGNSHVFLLFFLYHFAWLLNGSVCWVFGLLCLLLGVWVSKPKPCDCLAGCLQATRVSWVEKPYSASLTKASPEHKEFYQFSLPENTFP